MLAGTCRTAATLLTQTASKTALPYLGGSGLTLAKSLTAAPPSSVLLTLVRNLSSHRFNRNLEFFSADGCSIIKPKDKTSLCVAPADPHSGERPLTLLMCWLMSKDSHVKKFVRLYNDLGFDVLKIRISPFDLLRPTKGSQVVSGQMLEFLHQNPRHSSVLVHGFSVGCYLFCEGMVQVANDMARHGPLMDRLVGQIWDSPVDIQGIPVGTAKAVTNNKTLQTSIQKYLDWFLRVQYDVATVHYERSSAKMHEGFLNRPGLFLISRTDPVASVEMVSSVYNDWERKGIPYFVKIFDKSPHVSHYHKHKKEYVDEVLAYLERMSLVAAGKKRATA